MQYLLSFCGEDGCFVLELQSEKDHIKIIIVKIIE